MAIIHALERVDDEHEGLVLGAGGEEFEGILLVFAGDVDFRAVFAFHPVPATVGATEIELLGGEGAAVPLADVTYDNTIAKLQMLPNGEHQLMLTNGQAVKVSRSYKDRVKTVFSS